NHPYGCPQYLLYGGWGDGEFYSQPCWPEYQSRVTKEPLDRTLQLWKRGQDSNNEPRDAAAEAAIARDDHEGDDARAAPGQGHRRADEADIVRLPDRKQAAEGIREPFRITHLGICEVQSLDNGQLLDAEICIGTIATWDSQMDDRHQVILRFDDEEFIGRDRE